MTHGEDKKKMPKAININLNTLGDQILVKCTFTLNMSVYMLSFTRANDFVVQ